MKKYIMLLVFVLLLASCNQEDFLNPKSPSQFIEPTIFSNVDFARQAVYSAYNEFLLTPTYMTMFFYLSIASDIEMEPWGDESFQAMSNYAATDGTPWLDEIWYSLYRIIERTNICIDNLPKSPLWTGEDASEAQRLYAEAITLRAFAYNWLISIYGDVPFSTHSIQGGDNFFRPKTDRDSIYESVIKDLGDVEDYMPWQNQTLAADRISKGFIKGLRARMALNYAGWSLRNKTHETRRGRYWQDYYQIARQECLEIMQSGKHQLNPSFENIFRTLQAYKQDLTYGEILFELPWSRQATGGALGFTVGMRFSSGDPKYGYASPQIVTTPQYFYSFDRSDTRRNVSTELYNYAGTGANRSIQIVYGNTSWHELTKWRKSWMVPTFGSNPGASSYGVGQPIMRYSDVVLMFAETENEINGPTKAAKDALALVRQRAFVSNQWASKVDHYIDSVSVSKASFFNAIVDERAWEFGGEFYRKFDLIRWNLLGAKLAQMRAEVRMVTQQPVDPKFASKVSDYIFWKRNPDGETIHILNPDYVLPVSPVPEGYSRSWWLPLWDDEEQEVFYRVFDEVGHGFDPAKNNHLMPIANTVIAASNGTLTNDQIP